MFHNGYINNMMPKQYYYITTVFGIKAVESVCRLYRSLFKYHPCLDALCVGSTESQMSLSFW